MTGLSRTLTLLRDLIDQQQPVTDVMCVSVTTLELRAF